MVGEEGFREGEGALPWEGCVGGGDEPGFAYFARGVRLYGGAAAYAFSEIHYRAGLWFRADGVPFLVDRNAGAGVSELGSGVFIRGAGSVVGSGGFYPEVPSAKRRVISGFRSRLSRWKEIQAVFFEDVLFQGMLLSWFVVRG